MPTLDAAFSAVHSALVARFGLPPALFQGLGPFEAMCAVVLERTLAPQKVTAALAGLRDAEFLAPERLACTDMVELNDAFAEKGLSVSAAALAPLLGLARWLVHHHDGQVAALFDPHRSTEWLRGELASINGIGMAGADAVLLYALKRPAYPVDRATYRVLVRHGWLDPTATYDEARDLLVDWAASKVGAEPESELVLGAEVLADNLMALAYGMEQVGRRYCKAAAARCDDCPLVSLLPEGGCLQFDA
jgi:endonuclease III related protein